MNTDIRHHEGGKGNSWRRSTDTSSHEAILQDAGLISDRPAEPRAEPPPPELRDRDFPIEVLPSPLREMAEQVARCAFVPISLAATACIGVISASIGAGVHALDGERKIRANLYLLMVARSGSGKSIAFSLATRVLANKQKEFADEWRSVTAPKLRANEKGLEAKINKAKQDVGKGKGCQATLENLEIELQEVSDALASEPVLYVTDCTREGAIKRISTQPHEALAVITAEARGAVSVLQGRYSSNGKTDEDVFLASYSGDPLSPDRKSEGRTLASSPCMTLVWALQPDAWEAMISAVNLTESGLIPRFILFDTHAEAEALPIELPTLPGAVVKAWEELVASLLDFRAAETPEEIHFSAAAREKLRDYENECRARSRSDGDAGDISSFAARWGEMAWRLALLFHVIQQHRSFEDAAVSGSTACAAVKLMKWYVPEQLTLIQESRCKRLEERADKLAEKLEANECLLSFGDLKDSYNFIPGEVRQLVKQFPKRFKIQEDMKEGPGRKSPKVRLLQKSAS